MTTIYNAEVRYLSACDYQGQLAVETDDGIKSIYYHGSAIQDDSKLVRGQKLQVTLYQNLYKTVVDKIIDAHSDVRLLEDNTISDAEDAYESTTCIEELLEACEWADESTAEDGDKVYTFCDTSSLHISSNNHIAVYEHETATRPSMSGSM